MTAYEITTIVLSSLSIFATVVVAIVVAIMQHRNEENYKKIEEKKEKKREREKDQIEARMFLIEHRDEVQFLFYAQIADFIGEKILYYRDIYTKYMACRDSLKIEILRQAGIPRLFIMYGVKKEVIMEKFKNKCYEFGFFSSEFDPFYENAKYFKLAYTKYEKYKLKYCEKEPGDYFPVEIYYGIDEQYKTLVFDFDMDNRFDDFYVLSKTELTPQDSLKYYEQAKNRNRIITGDYFLRYDVPKKYEDFVKECSIPPFEYYFNQSRDDESVLCLLYVKMFEAAIYKISRKENIECKLDSYIPETECLEDQYLKTLYLMITRLFKVNLSGDTAYVNIK